MRVFYLGEPASRRGYWLSPRTTRLNCHGAEDPAPGEPQAETYCAGAFCWLSFGVVWAAGSFVRSGQSPCRWSGQGRGGEVRERDMMGMCGIRADIQGRQLTFRQRQDPTRLEHTRREENKTRRIQNPGEFTTRASRHRPSFCHFRSRGPRGRANRRRYSEDISLH